MHFSPNLDYIDGIGVFGGLVTQELGKFERIGNVLCGTDLLKSRKARTPLEVPLLVKPSLLEDC